MIQSNIILTKTFLNLDRLKKNLAWVFFNHNFSFDLSKNNDNFYHDNEGKIDDFYRQMMDNNRIISYSFKEKKEMKEAVMEFYYKREKPTLLFMGDLSSYSIPLQEGMLRFLEEPPQNLYIILFSKDKSIILPTITSRSNIISLSDKQIFSNLNSHLHETIQKKFPSPKQTAVDLYSKKSITVDDIKKTEREEIEYWLWQVKSYVELLFCKKPTKHGSDIILAIHKAMNLNNQNLQKKFVIESINLFG